MAQLPDFTPSTEISTGGGTFALIPQDTLARVVIVESSCVENKNKTGMIASFKCLITEGEFAGKWVWKSINITHQNRQAEQIGAKELNTIVVAAGLSSGYRPAATEELHEIPMVARIRIEKGEGQYRDKNVISTFYPDGYTEDAPPVQAASARVVPATRAPVAPAPRQAVAAAPAVAGKPSWKRS